MKKVEVKKGKPPAKKQIAAPDPKAETAVARRAPAAVATSTIDDDDLAQFQGAGMETATAADFAIPRLRIVQKGSKNLEKGSELFVEGAEVGMIINSVTNELYDGQEGIDLVLVSYRRAHLNWWPIGSRKGKGFIKDYGADPAILEKTTRDDKGNSLLADGSEIVPTAEYFAYLVDTETGKADQVVISMAKTQMIKSRKLITLASTYYVPNSQGVMKQAPLFYRLYHFSTKPESNDKGNWFGWEITPGADVQTIVNGKRLWEEAKLFFKRCVSGQVKVANPDESGDHGAPGGGGQAAGGQHQDDGAPM